MIILSQPQLVGTSFLFSREQPRHKKWEELIRAALLRQIAVGESLSDELRDSVAAFPQAVTPIAQDIFASEPHRRGLLTIPAVCLAAAYGHPQIAHYLEQYIALDGEASYEYSVWLSATGSSPHSRDLIETALLAHPYWAWRAAKETADEKLLRRVHDESEAKHASSPGAALFFLMSHDSEPVASHSSLIHQDTIAAYIATVTLQARGFQLDPTKLVGLNPCWATHFALTYSENAPPELIAVIKQHPGWAVEYAIRSGELEKDPASASKLIIDAQRRTKTPPRQPGSADDHAHYLGPLHCYSRMTLQWVRGYAGYAKDGKIADHLQRGAQIEWRAEFDQVPKRGGK